DDFAFYRLVLIFFLVGLFLAFGWLFICFFVFLRLLVHFRTNRHELVVQFFKSSFERIFFGLFVLGHFFGRLNSFVQRLFILIANLVFVVGFKLFSLVHGAV